MTKSTSDSLKGIFAISVLLCHVCGQSGFCMVHGVGAIITAFGYWGVSIFLFLSGYGLMKQYARFGGVFS